MTKLPMEEVRLDRWLMAARFYKTRSQAAKACEGRKVKVNGSAAKPHKIIRIGDKMTLHHHDRYRDIEVLGLADRGIPSAMARALFHEEAHHQLTGEDHELITMMQKLARQNQPKYKGRPTKKTRRSLDKFHERI